MSGMTSRSYNHDFLNETVGLTLEFLSDIIFDIQEIAIFDFSKEFHWNQKIIKLTSDISKFVELTTLLSKSLTRNEPDVLLSIKNSHIHLLFIMKGMNQALIKNDYVALEELIKYELKDNLAQWKIDLIPKTKKLLTT